LSRPDNKGRFAIVTNVGRGMRWTPWRCLTSGIEADGEVVWSRYPDADIKFATMSKHRGLRRWQKSPAHRGDHEGSRKTIAQGMPVTGQNLW